jgi:hypothetical protein
MFLPSAVGDPTSDARNIELESEISAAFFEN